MWELFQRPHLGPPETPRNPQLATVYVWLFVTVGLVSLARFVEVVWLDDTFIFTQILVALILFSAAVVFVRKWRRNRDYLRRAGIARRSRRG